MADISGGSCSNDVIADESSMEVTENDKKLARVTWAKLYKGWESQYGSAFFIRLFQNHPEIKKTFTALTHMSDDEILQSPVLRAHVLVFGNTVNMWIQKLDDTETLVALLQKLADSHVVRGVTNPAFFQDALKELLAYASETFSFTQEQVTAWTKIANLISSVLEQRVKDLHT